MKVRGQVENSRFINLTPCVSHRSGFFIFIKMNKIITIVLGAIITLSFSILLTALPVMWLCNDLVVDIFKLHKIDFWQALELATLCSLLFKSSTSSKND